MILYQMLLINMDANTFQDVSSCVFVQVSFMKIGCS